MLTVVLYLVGVLVMFALAVRSTRRGRTRMLAQAERWWDSHDLTE